MTSRPDQETDRSRAESFEARAGEGQSGVVGELVRFLARNKKWWLVPIVVSLLMVGLLIALGGTGAAPFIYTLF